MVRSKPKAGSEGKQAVAGAGDIALHQRIRAEIEAEIVSGRWPPGQRIPFEHELMARHGCARMTVSKALAGLVEAGLIERRRRAGSFVRRPPGQSAVLDIPEIRASIERLGAVYSFEITGSALRRPLATEGEFSPAELRQDVRAVSALHFADGEPFAFEERVIFLEAVPDARDADFTVEPPGSWLLQHVPWHEAEHRISAEGALPANAQRLAIEPGAACLVLARRTWRNGALVTAVRLCYPSMKQTLVARFTPTGVLGRS